MAKSNIQTGKEVKIEVHQNNGYGWKPKYVIEFEAFNFARKNLFIAICRAFKIDRVVEWLNNKLNN